MTATEPEAVTIVVPCYNEESSLPQLAERLSSLQARCNDLYQFSIVIVDDGSSDNTWALLQTLFGEQSSCQLIRLENNRGISAALAHGAAIAESDIICTMDSDCSYDPELFVEMIPILQDDVSMVTASPYHRDGGTRHVSAFRLLLSRGLSSLYRLVLHQKIATYTCCFRVYRQSALQAVSARHPGFIGIAEMAARLDHAGYKIIEYPAVLESRRYGVSKMRTLETILGHLKLLMQLAMTRLAVPGRPRPMRTQTTTAEEGPIGHGD